MLVFVDYEHADYDGEWAQTIQAARTWITYRLEDLAGVHCMLVRYDRIDDDLLDRLDAKALFISGQASDPAIYQPDDLAPLQDLVRSARLPAFGFCGGWQFLAKALGADLVPIEPTPAQAASDRIVSWPGGALAEFGYHPVDVTGEHELLTGLGPAPVFRHAHGLHVPVAPDGFRVIASTEVSPIQLAVDDDRRFVGAQFHPEYWTDEHQAGRQLLVNFLAWIGVTS